MSNYTIETPLDINPSGALRLYATNSANRVSISSAATSANVNFRLPLLGTANQYLQRLAPTNTGWTTPIAQLSGLTIPVNLRLTTSNMPVTPTVISSGTFTVLNYFIYGGTTTSNLMQQISVVFSITPANTNAEIRIDDVTTPTSNITTITCTSTGTGITTTSGSINTLLLPAGEVVISLSARITTATSISLYSINIS